MIAQPTTMIAACKDFFGFLPNQTLTQFRDEYKKLNEKDLAEIKAGLIQIGYKFQD